MKPKKTESEKWIIWYDEIPRWHPGIYEGLTEAEAMAQVGKAFKESDATAARSAAMEPGACPGQD